MLPIYASLFQIGSFFADIDLILKIVGLLLIMSFVRSHVQNGLLATILIVGLSAFLLFNGWGIFGAGLVAYLAVSFGVVGIIVDLFFFGGIMHKDPHEQQQAEMHAQQRINPELAAQLRARGINPAELDAEQLRELQGGSRGHEAEHEEQEHGHDGEGVSSQESKEMNQHRQHAGHALHGLMRPPSQQIRRHR